MRHSYSSQRYQGQDLGQSLEWGLRGKTRALGEQDQGEKALGKTKQHSGTSETW